MDVEKKLEIVGVKKEEEVIRMYSAKKGISKEVLDALDKLGKDEYLIFKSNRKLHAPHALFGKVRVHCYKQNKEGTLWAIKKQVSNV